MKPALFLLLASATAPFAHTNSAVEGALKTVPPGATDLVPRPHLGMDETIAFRNAFEEFSAFQANPVTIEFNTTIDGSPAVSAPSQNTAWDIVTTGSVRLAIPKGWRNFDGMQPAMVIFRQGDGIGVPSFDETGSPLQIGITVERFPPSERSLDVIAAETAAGAERDPRLKRIKKDYMESLALSDRTAAVFTSSEFTKSSMRRSLQMKLFTKVSDGTIWVVSGYIVGGKDSTLPARESAFALWLRAHMVSVTLTGKEIDARAIDTAYQALASSRE